MPTVVHFSERVGCGITLRLDGGETCLISVAQTGDGGRGGRILNKAITAVRRQG